MSVDEAYPDLLDGVDNQTRRRLTQTLGRTAPRPPHHEVRDLLDRLSGRITFEEYLRRNRARLAGRSPAL